MGRRTAWVGTSWKMNKGPAEAVVAARALAELSIPPHVQPFVVPPFTSLKDVCSILRDKNILVGAQNMHWENEGAWTGEVSPPMVKECGAALVELGHSERRTYFGETDQTVNLKVLAALKYGLKPLVCIGDTQEEYAFNVTNEVLARQVKIALHGVKAHEFENILLAYEPVWAIGEKGRPAETDFVQNCHEQVRQTLIELAGEETAERIPVLYGGSVNLENAPHYAALPNVDGVFVGRAAWPVAGFKAIIESIAT
ncbi:triose-phosphate isomerase [Kozakia baliensis]|uniref:triose-phosphate isomerase n=1 Tax=Kozakia baliensis TaxID=153496 RepID=UPI00345C2F68